MENKFSNIKSIKLITYNSKLNRILSFKMASNHRTVLTIQEQYELIRKNEQKPLKT